jgi:hypothetical protein
MSALGAPTPDESRRSRYDFIDGYPPDKQAKATETVLEQAALLSEEWATA